MLASILEELAGYSVELADNADLAKNAAMCIPFTVTFGIGVNEMPYATTRRSTAEWADAQGKVFPGKDNITYYVYGETQGEAAAALLLQLLKDGKLGDTSYQQQSTMNIKYNALQGNNRS